MRFNQQKFLRFPSELQTRCTSSQNKREHSAVQPLSSALRALSVARAYTTCYMIGSGSICGCGRTAAPIQRPTAHAIPIYGAIHRAFPPGPQPASTSGRALTRGEEGEAPWGCRDDTPGTSSVPARGGRCAAGATGSASPREWWLTQPRTPPVQRWPARPRSPGRPPDGRGQCAPPGPSPYPVRRDTRANRGRVPICIANHEPLNARAGTPLPQQRMLLCLV